VNISVSGVGQRDDEAGPAVAFAGLDADIAAE
jgi:hypothetical protein